jgi:predicted Zn-dependent protease
MAGKGRYLFLCLLPVGVFACTSRDAAPSKADAIRRGDELAAKYQYAGAASAYRIAVDRDPSDGHSRLKLASAYAADGRGPDAMKEAMRAADLLPGNVEAHLLAAAQLLQRGYYLDAIVRSSELLRDHPDDVNVIILWGNATAHLFNSTWALYQIPNTARSGDDFDRARLEIRPDVPRSEDAAAELALRKALRLSPTLMEAQLALVNFLWATGRPDEGEELLKRLAEQNPGHAAINHALGAFYQWRHRATEAEPYLKRAAMTGTYGRGARFALADLYIDENRGDDAVAILSSLPTSDDASGAVSLRAAPIEFRLGRREEAMRRIDGLLAREPHNPRAVLFKAQFLFAMRRLDDAVKFARAAVVEAPTSSDARSTLAQASFATGNLESAFDEYAEAARLSPGATQPQVELARLALALGRDREATRFAREAVRHLPGDRDAVVLLVKALVRARDFSGAEQELKPLLSRFPESPDLLSQLGTVQAARDDAAAARATFTRALQSDRDSFDALSGIVSLDLKEPNTGAARRRIEAVSAVHPDDPRYLGLAARVYAAENDAPLTESTLRRLLAIDPLNVDAGLTLSDFLVGHHRQDEARHVLEQLVERRPRSIQAQTSLALLHERMGHTDDARTRYKRIIAQDSRAGTASYRLAILYFDEGADLDAALNLALAAKQELPDGPAVSDLIGSIYARKNQPAYALANFEDAVRGAPNNAVYRYHLGSAYLSSGDFLQARAELTRALEIDQNFAQAAEARAALASLRR